MAQTIDRAIAIVEFVSEGARSLNEIADELGVHRSTALRQLQSLESARFVRRRADGRFAVGPRLIAIAQRALDELDVRQLAGGHLRSLQRVVGHTVHLAQLIGEEIIYVDKVEGSSSVRMYSRIGRPASPQASAVGKVVLSQLSPERRAVVCREVEWVAHTPTTHTSLEALTADLELIGERGWGVDDGEFEDFVNCIAAPVADSSGEIVAAVSITSIRAMASLADLQAFLPALRTTAAAISHDLG